jgi:hypothetical protein
MRLAMPGMDLLTFPEMDIGDVGSANLLSRAPVRPTNRPVSCTSKFPAGKPRRRTNLDTTGCQIWILCGLKGDRESRRNPGVSHSGSGIRTLGPSRGIRCLSHIGCQCDAQRVGPRCFVRRRVCAADRGQKPLAIRFGADSPVEGAGVTSVKLAEIRDWAEAARAQRPWRKIVCRW